MRGRRPSRWTYELVAGIAVCYDVNKIGPRLAFYPHLEVVSRISLTKAHMAAPIVDDESFRLLDCGYVLITPTILLLLLHIASSCYAISHLNVSCIVDHTILNSCISNTALNTYRAHQTWNQVARTGYVDYRMVCCLTPADRRAGARIY